MEQDKLREIKKRVLLNTGNGLQEDALYLLNTIKRLTDERDYWQGYGEESLRIEDKRLDEIKRLTEERNTLADFIRDSIRVECWGHTLDGGDLQDRAVELGLLREEPYDPDKHGAADAEPGDTIYVFSGPLERSIIAKLEEK